MGMVYVYLHYPYKSIKGHYTVQGSYGKHVLVQKKYRWCQAKLGRSSHEKNHCPRHTDRRRWWMLLTIKVQWKNCLLTLLSVLLLLLLLLSLLLSLLSWLWSSSIWAWISFISFSPRSQPTLVPPFGGSPFRIRKRVKLPRFVTCISIWSPLSQSNSLSYATWKKR